MSPVIEKMKGQTRAVKVVGALVLSVMIVLLLYNVVQGEFNWGTQMLDTLKNQ